VVNSAVFPAVDRTAQTEKIRPDAAASHDEEVLVKASVGDRITVPGLHVGDATRCGEVVEVKGPAGEPPYVVRWEDGHEAVFVPAAGVRVDPS
jgi:hypothetical protein